MVVQTAGRDSLSDFAPQFAALNDDVLFGQVWSDSTLDLRTRSLITITALISQGILDESARYHLENAKTNGVTRAEIASILTHLGFYAGWPKAWAAFRYAKDVWGHDNEEEGDHGGFFGIGQPNDAYAQFFSGRSYLNPLTIPGDVLSLANVTFEPGCRNNWHIHHATSGGGQLLICVDGLGWYQEKGKPARPLVPGDIVSIPANVEHWHGARADSWFSHLAISVPGENTSNEWLAPVTDEEYSAL